MILTIYIPFIFIFLCISIISLQTENLKNVLRSANETDEPLTEIARKDVEFITLQLSNVTQPQNMTIFPKDLETTVSVLVDISQLVIDAFIYQKSSCKKHIHTIYIKRFT